MTVPPAEERSVTGLKPPKSSFLSTILSKPSKPIVTSDTKGSSERLQSERNPTATLFRTIWQRNPNSEEIKDAILALSPYIGPYQGNILDRVPATLTPESEQNVKLKQSEPKVEKKFTNLNTLKPNVDLNSQSGPASKATSENLSSRLESLDLEESDKLKRGIEITFNDDLTLTLVSTPDDPTPFAEPPANLPLDWKTYTLLEWFSNPERSLLSPNLTLDEFSQTWPSFLQIEQVSQAVQKSTVQLDILYREWESLKIQESNHLRQLQQEKEILVHRLNQSLVPNVVTEQLIVDYLAAPANPEFSSSPSRSNISLDTSLASNILTSPNHPLSGSSVAPTGLIPQDGWKDMISHPITLTYLPKSYREFENLGTVSEMRHELITWLSYLERQCSSDPAASWPTKPSTLLAARGVKISRFELQITPVEIGIIFQTHGIMSPYVSEASMEAENLLNLLHQNGLPINIETLRSELECITFTELDTNYSLWKKAQCLRIHKACHFGRVRFVRL